MSENASDSVLHARDLRLSRGGTAILDGLDIEVPAGSRTLVRGTSGAGKTTLFSVLGLLEEPDSGALVVDGVDALAVSERKRARLRRDHIGIVFQDFQLIPDLTARENALLPQQHGGSEDDAWVDELFDRLGIADLHNQYPATLSGGERQRVGIARALSNRPRIVLADEPTGQLDPDTAAAIRELLFSVQRDTGVALVVVSHDASFEGVERTRTLTGGRLQR
ncbi:ABC transporter ATP-binding protein [Natronomonas sp. EA1]|uniref:ABC transporter ATP-binding protein n=1 Tax=Natronomonas sp. EA1 TaxID=3421655 RepID=UPI003EB81F28